MEVGSSGGLDKNQVYKLSNTTTDNLQVARSVSTIGSSKSVSSTQSEEIVALKQHTTHLTKKYEQLSELWTTHDSSHQKIWATLGELWTTPSNGHEYYITEGWYMCAPFLAVWSWEQLASSSSSIIV
jgi:hypothetical protein